MKHQHAPQQIQISEWGDCYYWKCACGAVGCDNITSEELVELLKLTYE